MHKWWEFRFFSAASRAQKSSEYLTKGGNVVDAVEMPLHLNMALEIVVVFCASKKLRSQSWTNANGIKECEEMLIELLEKLLFSNGFTCSVAYNARMDARRCRVGGQNIIVILINFYPWYDYYNHLNWSLCRFVAQTLMLPNHSNNHCLIYYY